MAELDMEYNSSKEELIIPEYGRNVQNLIQHAKAEPDPRIRQILAEKIIELMWQMSPQTRSAEDTREKLWRHLFQIAHFDIDVMPPSGVRPRPEDTHKIPDKVTYPQPQMQYRHYGSNVQNLIRKALEMPAGPKRDAFVAVIGSYMKLAYRTWNKEHYVSDDVIKADLEHISEGLLVFTDETSFDNLGGGNRGGSGSNNKRQRPPQQRGGYSGGGGGNYRNNRGGNNSNNKNQQSRRKK